MAPKLSQNLQTEAQLAQRWAERGRNPILLPQPWASPGLSPQHRPAVLSGHRYCLSEGNVPIDMVWGSNALTLSPQR